MLLSIATNHSFNGRIFFHRFLSCYEGEKLIIFINIKLSIYYVILHYGNYEKYWRTDDDWVKMNVCFILSDVEMVCSAGFAFFSTFFYVMSFIFFFINMIFTTYLRISAHWRAQLPTIVQVSTFSIQISLFNKYLTSI